MQRTTNTGDQYSISINIALAAKRLVDFMQKKENWPLLVNALKAGKKAYNDYFAVMTPVYWATRTRNPAIDKVIASINSSISEKSSHNSVALRLIDGLIRNGGMEVTSFNKHGLYELLALLPDYKETDPNPRETVTFDNLKLVRKQFFKESKRILDAVKPINLDDPKSMQVMRMQEQSVLTQAVDVKSFWRNRNLLSSAKLPPAGPVARGKSLGDKFNGIKELLTNKKPDLVKVTKPELSTTMKLAATLLASRLKGQEKKADEVMTNQEAEAPLFIEPIKQEQVMQPEPLALENNLVADAPPPPPPPPPISLRK